MFRLSVLQYQWLVLALFSGVAGILAMTLAYLAIWRPRKGPDREVAESGYEGYSGLRWYFSFMPWVLTLTYVAAIIFGILYAIDKIIRPPNW